MSRVGGHTGASLGAVELAVALHYAFDTPRDRLVWDVGHQAYAHKILTGRRDLLPTIKQYGGISGFLRRDESEYDTFRRRTRFHVSLRSARNGDRTRPKRRRPSRGRVDRRRIARRRHGDGSDQPGGTLEEPLIVVLNDNEMSIAPAVGALTGYLNRIRGAHGYHRFKDEVEEKLRAIPSVGERLHQAAKTMKDVIAAAVLPGALVSELGFKYIGYVDGHNPRALVAALKEAKQIKDGPVIVHALTTKGKGFPQAEPDYYRWHATGPFDLKPENRTRALQKRRLTQKFLATRWRS
jgi:1-deoxy-D-xylulose-5-phosphate synthase